MATAMIETTVTDATTFLSEPDAWRLIAERVDALPSHTGYLCDQVGYLAGVFGVQPAPFDYPTGVRVDAATHRSMVRRLHRYLDDDGNSAYENEEADWQVVGMSLAEFNGLPELVEFRQARVLAALWLACDADADGQSTDEVGH